MTERKITEITVETERVTTVSRRPQPLQQWCGPCARVVTMLRAEDAALSAGLSLRQICRLADAGTLHYAETPEGTLFICFDSLRK
ncbi:MAG TPA: hypothetical protein VF507_10855 [Pyrinomonadaceae bacterium]